MKQGYFVLSFIGSTVQLGEMLVKLSSTKYTSLGLGKKQLQTKLHASQQIILV